MNIFAVTEANLIGLFLVCLMVFYGKIQERDWRERNIFNWLLFANVILCISDMLTRGFDGRTFSGARTLLEGSAFVYNCSLLVVGYLWLLYCDVSIYDDRSRYKIRKMIYAVPTMFSVLVKVVNLKNQMVYYYDEQNVYHRGELYEVHILIVVVYMVIATGLIFSAARSKDRARKKEIYSLLGFIGVPGVAIVAEMLYEKVSLIPLSIALSLLMLFLQRIIAMITKDSLTGLDNQRSFERTLEDKVRSVNGEEKLFVLMADANAFKAINDNYGHDVGDEALVRIANVIRRSAENTDYLARLGGDEFVVIGYRKDQTQPEKLCERIQTELEAENRQVEYTLSVSMGYAVYDPEKHKDGAGLYKSADQKMYEMKRKHHAEHGAYR